jgi:transposase-like protein
MVRTTVEQTLNDLLDAEAESLCGAKPYERSESRKALRSGHYERDLETKAGPVTLKVPKLKGARFETAIIERYRRRESSVEEALVEMYLAGVSVRRVEDITEALWGTRVSASTVSELNQKIYGRLDAWRNRPIDGSHPYVYLDGIWLKRCWGEEVRNVSVLVAIAVNQDGMREVIGVAEGMKEDKASWPRPERHAAVHLRLLPRPGRSLGRVLPRSCLAALHRAFLPQHLQRGAQHSGKGSRGDAESDPRPGGRRRHPSEGEGDHRQTGGHAPDQGRRFGPCLNPLERLNREIRRRTRVVGAFPDGNSAVMLISARLRHVAGTAWGSKRYLNMDHLIAIDHQPTAQEITA